MVAFSLHYENGLDFKSRIIIRLCARESGNLVYRGLAQMARALGLGPRGREFESRVPDT